jgi:putative FmdB family regulatory protein
VALYDFKCDYDGIVVEVRRPMSDRSDALCPKCGTVMQQVMAPATPIVNRIKILQR